MLDELDFGRTDVVVRVNSAASGLAEADMDVALQAERFPDTLMLPKVEKIEHIDWVTDTGLSHFPSRDAALCETQGFCIWVPVRMPRSLVGHHGTYLLQLAI